MYWEAIGAIGQVLGSIAVFITLVYLSIQTRHAARESRRAAALARSQAERELHAHENDGECRRAVMKAYRGLGFDFHASGFYSNRFVERLVREAKLTQEEAFTVFTNEMSWWSYRVSMIAYLDDLPPIARAELTRQIQIVYGNPGLGRTFYEDFAKSFAHADAIRFIEQSIAMPSAS